MGLEQLNERRARKVLVHPGGAYRVLERIYNRGTLLTSNAVREAVMLVAPVSDRSDERVFGFRPQDTITPGLRLTPEWDVDDVGYNFDYTIPPDVLDERGRAYMVTFMMRVLGPTQDIGEYEIRREYEIQAGSGIGL